MLLQFDGTASCFDLGFDLFGFVFGNTFLDRFRRAFDQGFCVGQAQRGDGTNFLDHLDLLAAVAGQDNVEFVFFFSRTSVAASTASWTSYCNRQRQQIRPTLLRVLWTVQPLPSR